jgi:hypothetical protein
VPITSKRAAISATMPLETAAAIGPDAPGLPFATAKSRASVAGPQLCAILQPASASTPIASGQRSGTTTRRTARSTAKSARTITWNTARDAPTSTANPRAGIEAKGSIASAMRCAKLGRGPMTRAAATGRNTSAASRLTRIEMHSGSPSAPNMIRSTGFSLMKMSGMNTTTVVKVESKTGSATSRVPAAAAVKPRRPLSRNREMFSTTTTASSTSIPIASVMPVIVSTFSEPPPK